MACENFDVFISHTGNDTDVAFELKEFIESEEILGDDGKMRKLKAWTFSDAVLPGQDIIQAFGNAIAYSRRFVMIYTMDMLKSDYCMLEYSMANYYQIKRGMITCIPVLYKGMTVDLIPPFMRHIKCLECRDTEYKDKLLKAIKHDVPVSSVIEVNRTGVGLAWSYFYGYLDIILPDIQSRIAAVQAENSDLKDSPIYPKFITIVPQSCNTPTEINQVDSNFQFAFHLKKVQTVAGNQQRDYTNSVYKFTYYNPKNKVQESRHLVMEYATPVRSLRKMYEGGLAKLEEKEMRMERDKFVSVVMRILDDPQITSCNGKCIVVDFKDMDITSTAGIQKRQTLTQSVLAALDNDEVVTSMKKVNL